MPRVFIQVDDYSDRAFDQPSDRGALSFPGARVPIQSRCARVSWIVCGRRLQTLEMRQVCSCWLSFKRDAGSHPALHARRIERIALRLERSYRGTALDFYDLRKMGVPGLQGCIASIQAGSLLSWKVRDRGHARTQVQTNDITAASQTKAGFTPLRSTCCQAALSSGKLPPLLTQKRIGN